MNADVVANSAKDQWVERVLGLDLRRARRPAEPASFSKVAFEKIHLEWQGAKRTVEQRLDALHAEIVAEFADPEGASAAGNLARVLSSLNLGLGDQLDELRNAETPQARRRMAAAARNIAASYRSYLQGDELVRHVEGNPFGVVVDAPAVLGAPLGRLEGELAKLGL